MPGDPHFGTRALGLRQNKRKKDKAFTQRKREAYVSLQTHTHTHTTSGRRLPNLQEKEGPSLVRLTLLTLYSTTLNNTNTTTGGKKQ